MYDNLLHQHGVAERLSQDLHHSTLPPALLFSGPALAGKLTAALETARVISCRKEGQWICKCPSCHLHRMLSQPRTIITGNRDLGPEIAASAEVLRRDTSDAPRYLVVRAARKLLRRFDPILWEGEEKKITPLKTVMERLSETLEDLLPGRKLPQDSQLEKILTGLVNDCAVLQKRLPGVLPISQIRHLTSWVTHSVGSDHKTLIIDHAHRMTPGAQNALLKFLEEPPPDTTAILITDQKSLLLPTIISRLRNYSFRRRTWNEENAVLMRVFREKMNRYPNLTAYFRAWRSTPMERMQSLATAFIDSAYSENFNFSSDMANIKDSVEFEVFLEAVLSVLQSRWRNEESISHKRRYREVAFLRDARMRVQTLNLPIHYVLRSLQIALGRHP